MAMGRLIDPPPQFAPKQELQAFISQYEADPDPDVQKMVSDARDHLEGRTPPRKAGSLKAAMDAMLNPHGTRQATTTPAPPSKTPMLDWMAQKAAAENARAAAAQPALEPTPAPPAPEERQFDWATAKVGDHFPDGRGVIIGKGMTDKAEAEALAAEEKGTVWIDGPGKWGVVVPKREPPGAWVDADALPPRRTACES